MSDEFDIDIDPETDPPDEKPADFHERLVLTLKTTDPATLKAAERDYRGVFRDVRAYLDAEIRKTLPPEFAWLLACCATTPLLAAYEHGRRKIWTISLPKHHVMVFESQAVETRRLAPLR